MRIGTLLLVGTVIVLETHSPRRLRAQDAGASVYVLDSLRRATLTGAPPDQRKTAAVLYGAKGEVQAFQIVINGGAAGLDGVDAALASPFTTAEGTALPSQAVVFYREHFVSISKPSNGGAGGAQAGTYPDALIPFRNPFTGERLAGGIYVPAPFQVSARQNQVIYVEIAVPDPAAAGVYNASISITSQRGAIAQIPVTLTVWNFSIPRNPSLHSAFHDYDSEHLIGPAKYYGYSQDSPEHQSLAIAMDEGLLANRVVPEIPVYSYFKIDNNGHIAQSPADDDRLMALVSRPERSDFKLYFEEHGPFGDPLGADRQKAATYLNEAYQWFDRRGLTGKLWLRPQDEPQSTADFVKTQAFADLIHTGNPNLKVAITGDFDQPGFDQFLFGRLNTFVMGFGAFDPVKAAQQQAVGEQFWSYTGLVEYPENPSPYWQIEFPLLNFRIIPWIDYRYGLRGMLYWTTAKWNEIYARGHSPWTDPCSVSSGGDCFNGDGMLVYPGKEVGYVVPAGAYGSLSPAAVYGPIPSLRLKSIRDGMQDYELVTLAARRDPAAVKDVVMSVGCTDAVKNCFHAWNTDPDALPRARVRLAEIVTGVPGPDWPELPNDAGAGKRH
jgi:hypothetical protein